MVKVERTQFRDDFATVDDEYDSRDQQSVGFKSPDLSHVLEQDQNGEELTVVLETRN